MPVAINGSGTITGVSVGGLPDGIVDTDMIAADAVTDAKQSLSGAAKAWVNFDGSGTVSIRDSFNVGSITDNGTGDYTVTFTTAMANVNYAVAGTVAEVGSTGNSDYFLSGGRQNNYSDIRTTTFARIAACAASGAQVDGHVMSVVIFGD